MSCSGHSTCRACCFLADSFIIVPSSLACLDLGLEFAPEIQGRSSTPSTDQSCFLPLRHPYGYLHVQATCGGEIAEVCRGFLPCYEAGAKAATSAA